MRTKNLLLIIQLFLVSAFSQNDIKDKYKKFTNPPPGTIKLNDSLYIDVAPVDNLMYRECFVNVTNFWNEEIHQYLKTLNYYGLNWDILEKDTGYNHLKFIKSKKESLKFIFIDSSNEYIGSPKYHDFPALNITKEEAKLYCKWRTDIVKLNWAIISKNEKKRAKYPKNILYRLPTTKEFNSAIKVFGYSKKKHKPYKAKPIYPYRLKYKKNYKKTLFFKNNISEYTLDSIPFNTNWKKETNFNSFNDYTGFRCVCEIIE